MDLIGFLYGFGVLHGIVLAAILLCAPAGNRMANAFMAVLVTCIAIRFMNNWLIRTGTFLEYPQWGLLSMPLDLAWGPLLYLYARAIAGRPLGAVQALHFIPCLLMFSGPIAFASYSSEQQVQFLHYFWSDRQGTGQGRQILESAPSFWRYWIDLHLHGAFFTLQFGSYCYLVLRQIKQHNLALEQHFSFTDKMNLRWLRILTYLCVLFLVLFLVFNRARLVMYGQFESTELGANSPFLFMVLVIYIIGIMALRQPRMQDGDPPDAETDAGSVLDEATPVNTATTLSAQSSLGVTDSTAAPASRASAEDLQPVKYARSGVSLEDALQYKIRLMETMEEKQLYLNCDLTLGDLAEEAGISYHQASQVINGQLNQKFFSFVNNYRIQRAKELLVDPKTSSMPIVELALEVGFKSKSSFYDAFKKTTQLTPTQYKKSLIAAD